MNDVTKSAPSAYRIEQALSAWQSARARLLAEDPALENDEAALIDALGPEEGDIRSILTRLLRGALHARDMQSAAKARKDLIAAREARYKARAESMVRAAFDIMQATGERRFELPDLVASVRLGPQSVFVTSEDELPEMYWHIVTERSPDKVLIGKMLKAGQDVPGATLANGAENLVLKGS